MDGLTQAIEAIDRLGISRECVHICVFSAIDPPQVTLNAEEFKRIFSGRVAELSPCSEDWERLRIADGGIEFTCSRRKKDYVGAVIQKVVV